MSIAALKKKERSEKTQQKRGDSLLKLFPVEAPIRICKWRTRRPDIMATEYTSATEALKLVSPFNGNRKEILTFVSNVDTAFNCVRPGDKNRLYQFILTKISGEPRTAISHRNLENWDEFKEFLKNTYIEKRTLYFRANQLFTARQNKTENISE
jgi:hypothetical protein